MITRPSQMHGVQRFDPFSPASRKVNWEAEREARMGRWLERLAWFAAGASVGTGAVWLGLLIAALAYPS